MRGTLFLPPGHLLLTTCGPTDLADGSGPVGGVEAPVSPVTYYRWGKPGSGSWSDGPAGCSGSTVRPNALSPRGRDDEGRCGICRT